VSVRGQYVSQHDLEVFAQRLLPYLRSRGVDASWFKRTTVTELWDLLGDLPTYAYRKGWSRIEKFTAETLTPWDQTYRADRAYLQTEGYVLGRRSFANLPIDNRAWDAYFFGGNTGAWFLLRMWVHYLKHATWLEE
jgi:hypothetical protein